eukprot:g10749.t1
MGGAVVVEAAYQATVKKRIVEPKHLAVITLGGQSGKAGNIVNLGEDLRGYMILQGGADRCIKPACGRGLYKRATEAGIARKQNGVTYKEFEGEGHDTESAFHYLIKEQKLLRLIQ